MSDTETGEQGENADAVSVLDADTLAYVSADGEVLGVADAPPGTAEARDVAVWLGERRARAKARLAGLEAEKADWLARINAQYDPQIKKQRGLVAWLEEGYAPLLRDYLYRLIEGGKARSARVGLLLLKLGKTSARIDIADEQRAVAALKARGLGDAVQVREGVSRAALKDLPPLTKLELGRDPNAGIAFHPGGEDKFSIE